MTYDAILAALADPTRRAVLDVLRAGPCAVGRIAEDLPVSRPAVSQHLKVLTEAGLVAMQQRGTRNIYELKVGGAAPLVGWLGALHPAPEAAPDIAGWSRTLTTRLTPAETWTLFCDDLAIWWPVARISVSAMTEGALPQSVTLSAKIGGPLRETLFDGTQGVWATVTAVDAPRHIALDWILGQAEPSPVAVAFAAEGGGCRMTLRLGRESDEATEMWGVVLDRFAAAANASLTNF